MPEDGLEFAPTTERMSEVMRMVLAGDPIAAGDALRNMTKVPLGDDLMWGIIAIGIIWALGGLLKQARPIAQPFADAFADKIREGRTDKVASPTDDPPDPT